jgi:hypothetical protein
MEYKTASSLFFQAPEKSFIFSCSMNLRYYILSSDLLVLSLLRLCLSKPIYLHPRPFLQLPLLLYRIPLEADTPSPNRTHQKGTMTIPKAVLITAQDIVLLS